MNKGDGMLGKEKPMKPEIALKIDYDRFKEYTREQVETTRDEWIAAYREIARSDSSKKELCDSLTDRISRAAELFIRRHIEPAKSDAISHDDYYYEWLDEVKKEEDDSLDGDFPLGNEADMVFASPYFTIKELAMIQTGCSDRISPDSIPEYMGVRDGFLKETAGLTTEAREAYVSYNRFRDPEDEAVNDRWKYIDACNFLEGEYEKLLEYCEEADQWEKDLNSIVWERCRTYCLIRKWTETARNPEFALLYRQKMMECYQNALERNYKKIKEYKERGVVDFSETDTWVLTLDKNGNPAKTAVIGVDEYGKPIFADDSTDIPFVGRRRSNIKDCCRDLGDLAPYNDNLYELLAKAHKLKEQGPLGAEPYPTPNYDLDGLSGGRLDAVAWQNYAIEHGMVRHVDYDASLNKLIEELQELIELYEKALSIV